jgi:hypothetical protein
MHLKYHIKHFIPICMLCEIVYDHITLNTPVLARSSKLSIVEWSQYLDG